LGDVSYLSATGVNRWPQASGSSSTELPDVLSMLPSPQPENEHSGPASAADPVAVREQLNRLLAHPLFTNSKRYPVLLAYTVEQTLLGHAHELKERTIGVEAFGREPRYDVNLDPVVRTTAAEVRKRLIQYYYNRDHAGELVIELPLGAYVPSFREPQADSDPEPAPSPAQSREPNADATPPASALASPGFALRHWVFIGACLMIALLLGVAIGRTGFPRRPSNLERFWSPLTSYSGRITYCLGESNEALGIDRPRPADAATITSIMGNLNVSDVNTLARSIVPLVPRHNAFRVVSASETDFAQLREGPDVLIGAFNNPWTLRITQDLPFGFEADGHLRELVDRKTEPSRFWTLQWQTPNIKLAQDYAIVARIHDNVTGQPVIILAGIFGEGTQAASEVVSNPVYLDKLVQKAPRNWDKVNIEAVIETNVIEDHPGPPTVLAVETW
jgi:hypothetical protein